MSVNARALALLSASFLLTPEVMAADRPWLEVRSDHFIVATDSNEKTARTLAWQFEQVRAAVRTICPWARAEIDRPVLVFAARDENTMKSLAPKYWENRGSDKPSSVSAYGSDRHYIALRADELAENTQGVNPYLNAYWQYSILTINAGLRRELPVWFDRGLAHVLSNTNVRSNDMEVGRVIPHHLQLLRSGAQRMRLREFLVVDRKSPWATLGTGQFPVFDSESFAFMHFLLFADGGTRRPLVDRLVGLIVSGVPAAAAVSQTFTDVDALERDFFLYLTRDVFQYGSIKADVNQNREKYTARPWTPAEALARQGLFHAAMDRPVEARALVAAAHKADPAQPDAYEVEGLLADDERNLELARAAYEKAVELGSTSFYAHFRFATLIRPGADQTMLGRVAQSLEKAATLNPNFAPTYQQLGGLQMQLGRSEPAIVSLRRAVELQPEQVAIRLSLARALNTVGQRADALREATAALATATNDNEKRLAQQALDQYSR